MFNEKFLECDFSVIYDLAGVNEAWDTVNSKFLGILNKCAPLKEVGIKQQSEPWVNADLLETIEQRDHNLKLFRKSKLIGRTAKITYTLEIRLTTKLNTLNQCTLKKVYLIIKINPKNYGDY